MKWRKRAAVFCGEFAREAWRFARFPELSDSRPTQDIKLSHDLLAWLLRNGQSLDRGFRGLSSWQILSACFRHAMYCVREEEDGERMYRYLAQLPPAEKFTSPSYCHGGVFRD